MHHCSESSAKPKIVDRLLPANLSSHFLFPFDVLVIIDIDYFLKQFPLVQQGFIFIKDVTGTVGSLFSIVYCLNVVPTTAKFRTGLVKTCLASSEACALCAGKDQHVQNRSPEFWFEDAGLRHVAVVPCAGSVTAATSAGQGGEQVEEKAG